ncbi:RING/U-box superfamily protein [Hibiscus syriacus]|uniref:Acyl-[acyl-carrier-protein] hydrolase n=1 Tax=Hibiscus syriacus TaxID=106335 RepID=A0A6A3D3R7_HIBSY|nr:RING/U-box superfamily protein [Hibiscus syriacus]
MPYPSTWNPINKSKIWLQRVNIISNDAIEKTVKFRLNCSSKIKPNGQPSHGDEIRVPSGMRNMQNKDNITSPLGTLIKGGQVFQQNACVRSFDIDTECKMSTKAIMNYLQEALLNYSKKAGLQVVRGFGTTPGMLKMDLVWVFRDMRIEVDQYPGWGDVVQILSWAFTWGMGVRYEWTMNDINNGETLVRASCLAVMMNNKTRKACKLPEEVKDEIKAYLTMDADPIVKTQRCPIPRIETMDHIKSGLTPGWNDLDVNYHVNNAKYVDWILESTPDWIIYSHELWKINFEYRKECLKDDVIQSLSRVVTNETNHLWINGVNRGVELEHVLRLESGIQVLRARTAWRPSSIYQPSSRANNNMFHLNGKSG